jgi:cyclohexa-1,5-dienecarbonyl-CoA hydratase
MREIETGPLHVERLEAGAYWDVELSGSKGNVLDSALIDALISIFEKAASTPEVKAICLRGRGKDFSFGASVREHLLEEVGRMLPRFHQLFRAMDASTVVALAAVRGQCLGGGLELASFCHRVFAASDAKLGQPEIVLGVFAPVASLVLPERIGRANAEDLCLTGRIVGASEAAEMGLVDVVTEEPEKAALAYAREHLLPRSASSLRHAVRALRLPLSRRLEGELARLERLYLEELMGTEDAAEGIQAFLEKRAPVWRNR